MEKIIASGVVDGVLDATLVEIVHNMIPGGFLDAGPYRLETAGRLGLPQVVSLGGLDVLCFGPLSALPAEYRTRALFENNANYAGVRTSQEECTHVGEIIAAKLNKSRGPVTLFIPRGGLSIISTPGKVFEDEAADKCLFQSLRNNIDPKVVRLIERDENINDPRFAEVLVDALHEYLKDKLLTNTSTDEH